MPANSHCRGGRADSDGHLGKMRTAAGTGSQGALRNGRLEVGCQAHDGVNEREIGRTPAARCGLPGDFAGITAFLASPASGFVTGTAIPGNGGYSIRARSTDVFPSRPPVTAPMMGS
jgi:NAD(P)-dependent dehydrogenase (short-subunit alcohol dehydrogenase family)